MKSICQKNNCPYKAQFESMQDTQEAPLHMWSIRDSNLGPSGCKADVITTIEQHNIVELHKTQMLYQNYS